MSKSSPRVLATNHVQSLTTTDEPLTQAKGSLGQNKDRDRQTDKRIAKKDGRSGNRTLDLPHAKRSLYH
ncbi:hypothetical protein LX36DRAFT_664637 [Colletotrichum falcatum]|nr:hypothetical protein LX36DRAFT_664637 [Colletotrichum falcatum]